MRFTSMLVVTVLAAWALTARADGQTVPPVPMVPFGSGTPGAAVPPPAEVDVPIPLPVKTAADVSASLDVITNAIKARFEKLADDSKPDDQSKARIWLIGQIAHDHGQADPSASFKNVYSEVVNQQCLALLDKKPSVRVRINIALVTAKVVGYAKTANLYPTVNRLLADTCDGVVALGIVAAGDLWPTLYDSNAINAEQKAAFLETIVKAGITLGTAQHEVAPEIIDNVYKALDTAPAMDVKAKKLLIAANLEVLSSRAAQYRDGKHAVLDPEAEGNGFASILIPDDWHSTVLSDAQKTKAGQLASDIMALAANRITGKNVEADRSLLRCLQIIAAKLQLLNSVEWKDQTLDGLLPKINALNINSVVADGQTTVAPVIAELHNATPLFATLKAPPALTGAATQP